MHYLTVLFVLGACELSAQSVDSGTMPWQDRWDNYVQRTYDWKRVSLVAAETAFNGTFQLKRCGRPPYCFPHDLGGALAGRTARTSIELGAGALFHENLRRRPSGLIGFRQRVTFALVHAPLARGRDGEWEPAYSRFAGTFGSAVVSSAWRGQPMTAGHLFAKFGWSTTSYFPDSLFTEFEPDLKRLGQRYILRHFHKSH